MPPATALKHVLKIHKHHYQPVEDGLKRVEIRYNDRGYQVGDVLDLKEYVPDLDPDKPGVYTGRHVKVKVTHIVEARDLPNLIAPGYVLLSIDKGSL